MSTGYVFRAIWPITDQRASFATLCSQAAEELPLLVSQAHAAVTGPGRWTVAAAATIPGSGNHTRDVLLFQAPAQRRALRPYSRRLLRAVS